MQKDEKEKKPRLDPVWASTQKIPPPDARKGVSSGPGPESIPTPPEIAAALNDSERCLNQYVLVKEVGRGGMGTVWKAWDTKLARWVAVKFLNVDNETGLRRFEREAQLVAQLHHPNIAGIHEIGEAKESHFLVMDFIEGAPIGQEEISLQSTVETFVKICRAIQFAHDRSIIHRDIKPGNILLRNDGEPFVTDFGLGKALKIKSSLSLSGTVIGTPAFMSPEQALGDLDAIDTQSDVYSLGATLYTLVTHRTPFEGTNPSTVLLEVTTVDPKRPRSVDPRIPPEIEAIILKAMEKKKADRYTSADAMADDLQRFLDDRPVTVKSPGLLRRTGRILRRNPWPVATGLIFLVATGIVAFMFLRPDESPPPNTRQTTDVEGDWKARFEPLRSRLSYYGFQSSSPTLVREAREVLAGIPDPLVEEIANWFQEQASRPPGKVWPKSLWLDRQPEARRIRDWCAMMEATLEGLDDEFDPVRSGLAETADRFLAVTAYRGQITLKLLFRPYAELRAFRVGDQWVVRDGEKLKSDVKFAGEDLFTPLVIRHLDIGTFSLVLSHPELGRHEFTIDAGPFSNGTTYIYSGSMDNPESVRLRRMP
jgi:serine/threonine protein kinase